MLKLSVRILGWILGLTVIVPRRVVTQDGTDWIWDLRPGLHS